MSGDGKHDTRSLASQNDCQTAVDMESSLSQHYDVASSTISVPGPTKVCVHVCGWVGSVKKPVLTRRSYDSLRTPTRMDGATHGRGGTNSHACATHVNAAPKLTS
jgi:hypothetical protein